MTRSHDAPRRPDPSSDAGGGGDSVADIRAERDRHGDRLTAAALEVIPGWVQHSVTSRLRTDRSDDASSDLVAHAAAAAVEEARSELAASVRRLPGVDTGPPPLQVFRTLVRHPTAVLQALDVPVVARGEFEQRAFPDDIYDLSPATWADIDPTLHEPGLTWGAATAYLHKALRADR